MSGVVTPSICAPAMRYHGGKFRLAPWIQGHFPPHRTYVEPFGGAASVLITKERAYSEVYNDLDGDVVNLFKVLQNDQQRHRLLALLAITPYARAEFEMAFEATEDAVERARRLLIRAQMGFGSAGATKGRTGFRIDSKRAYGTSQSLWVEFPDNLRAVAARFAGVLIENRPAVDIMAQHDSPETLHYVDPPYVHATRQMRGARGGCYYQHEMSDADHEALLTCMLNLDGMVLVSGYTHPLYDEALSSWRRSETKSRISSGRGSVLRTEVLWCNPAASAAHQHSGIFAVALA